MSSKKVNLASAVAVWIANNVLSMSRHLRWAYLPPVLVYFAFGASALTSIASSFWVKESLTVSPAFLAEVLFWASIPWILKVPIGHAVDRYWRWKGTFLYLGAGLLGASYLIQLWLVQKSSFVLSVMPAESWYPLSAILGSAGLVIQDVVADAMTVEAVSHPMDDETAQSEQSIRRSNVVMQTLGRVAVVAGSMSAGLLNFIIFDDIAIKSAEERWLIYQNIFLIALAIPVVSIVGLVHHSILIKIKMRKLRAAALRQGEMTTLVESRHVPCSIDWPLVAGSLAYVTVTLCAGALETILRVAGISSDPGTFWHSLISIRDVLVFLGSSAVVVFLVSRLRSHLSREQQATFTGTILVIFITGLIPQFGEGVNWWQIDVLGIDQHVQSVVMLVSNCVALLIMAVYLRFLGDKSVLFVSVLVGILGAAFMLPYIGMFWGFHNWLANVTSGFLGAKTIVVMNFAMESPLQQVVMIPAMAWAAAAAPPQFKATFFAVIATFANVASSGSRLFTKMLNQVWHIERGNYENVGVLMITVTMMMLLLPIMAGLVAKLLRRRVW